MFSHSILFAVNNSLCTDEDILFYQYQYYFDILLHLSPGRNPVKSAQNALIIDESTFASSFNFMIPLCGIFTNSLLYTLVENLVLSASFSSLMAHHLNWHNWHQARTKHWSCKLEQHHESWCTYYSLTTTLAEQVLWKIWVSQSKLLLRKGKQ